MRRTPLLYSKASIFFFNCLLLLRCKTRGRRRLLLLHYSVAKPKDRATAAVVALSVAFASWQGSKIIGRTSVRKRKKERKEGDCNRCRCLLRCTGALQCSVARKEEEEGDGCCHLLHCAALQQEKKKKVTAAVTFFVVLHRSKKKRTRRRQRIKNKKRRRRRQSILSSPSSLHYSAARKKEEEEGDGSHAAVAFFLFFLHCKQEEEEKKEKGLLGSHMGLAPAPSSKLLKLLQAPNSSSSSSSKLQAPAPPPSSSSSRSTFLELWRWSEVGGR